MMKPLNIAKTLCASAVLTLCAPVAAPAEHPPDPNTATSAAGQLIPWLLDENQQLREIDFQEVIFAATGKHIHPIDSKSEVDRRVIKQLSGVLDEAMKRMNAPGSPMQSVARINEVSSHVEDLLRELLNAVTGLSCDFPRTSEGHVQRSGYPDLALSISRAGAFSISTRSFTRPAAGTAVSAHFTSSRKSRRTRCATTRYI